MLIKGVEFPEQLILAQRNGEFVIFAGAGVSLDRPSSLPTFVELTEGIILRKLKNSEKDQMDRVLGASKQAGVNVHLAAREIVDKEGSLPTVLHVALLNLFPDPLTVRVVTTNFDRHFSSAAKKLFSDHPEEYYAPALPLGNDFRGIAYLHGSLERDEQRFVLTDSDFGRAYLTEGWATRFLWALFRTYTVLFVGYSHNDPVMHYLSKGLPSETIGKRYALTPGSDADRWKSLDIIPLPYPVSRRSHKAMTTAVTAWAKLSEMGALDYEHRIRSIVEGSTYLSDEDSSFILYALKHTSYAKFFAKYAVRLDWLLWAEVNDLLKPLFQPDWVAEKHFAVLADWITDNYLIDHTDALLALIQRQGQHLNPLLWNAIAWKLRATKPRPDSIKIARIIPILLKSSHPMNQIESLNLLLVGCTPSEHDTVALLLFEFLTKPQINLQRGFSMGEGEKAVAPSMEIETPGDEHWLQEAWKKVFSPNIECFADELENITSAHLLKADMLQRSFRGPDAFDTISYSRSAIEAHEQDQYPGKIDVLIDAARDSVECLIKNDPDMALHLINKWYGAAPEIMRRIATHALAECAISADHKIEWLLDRELLFNTGCVHEVFRVLKVTYPKANSGIRKKLLKIVKLGERGKDKNTRKLDKETKIYEIYNLLYWVKSADPTCPLAEEAFLTIQLANPEFPPREHPDFHHWSSGAHWIGHESPITVEELLSREPAEQLEFLLTYKGNRFDGPNREGLLNTITQAVQQDFDWGYKLAQALIDAVAWETDIWRHIFRGWEDGLEEDSNLIAAIGLIIDSVELFRHDYHIANLIQKKFNEKKPVSDTANILAMQLAEMLMDYLEVTNKEQPENVNDWLQETINHSGGKLAEFWVHTISRNRKAIGDAWSGLPDEHRRCLDKMISGASLEAQLARVFIASQLYFMFYMDAPWTIKHVLPLFDWSDPLRARQCWDGYLFWGRYGENTLPHIMPHYRKTFRELHSLRKEQRRRFCEHMASIAIYSSTNPIEDGWLLEFIASVDESDRVAWAQQFEHLLRDLDDEATKLLWDQWLDNYWHRRNIGQPAPLSPSELGEMVKWSSSLGSVFDKAVKMICGLSAPEISDSYMFHLMNEKDFAKKHTKELAKLLIHLIPQMTKSWVCHELIPLARALRDAGLDAKSFTKIQNGLVALGCDDVLS